MDADRLAARLIEARRSGERIAALADDETPKTAAEGYAVQEAMIHRLGIAVGGWKVGADNPTAEPQAGPLLVDRLKAGPASFAMLPNAFRTVEAEIAFIFGKDLPLRDQPYVEADIWEAIASLHVGIEILESSFVERRRLPPNAPLGDLLNNGGYTYGPALTDFRALDLVTPQGFVLIDGKEVRRAKSGTPGGAPGRLMAWLANHAAGRGRPLKRGDIVTTGSHTGMLDAPAGAHVTARFEGIGEASLIFA